MNRHRVRTVVGVLGLTLALVLPVPSTSVHAAKPGGGSQCPITQSTDFVIYGQMLKGGVGTSSKSWTEPVKPGETRPDALFCQSTSFGLLIQAGPGSCGGSGRLLTKRSGCAA